MRILMILSPEVDDASDPRHAAALLEWAAGPYYVFRDAGMEVVLASIEGGSPLKVITVPDATPDIKRLKQDSAALSEFSDTLRLDQIYAEDFSGVFLVGRSPFIPQSFNCPMNDMALALLKAGRPLAAAVGPANVFPVEIRAMAIISDGGKSPIEVAHALVEAVRQLPNQ